MNSPCLSNLYVDRPEITDKIRRSIINNKITNIYGSSGIGKTTICNFCLNKYFYDTNVIIMGAYKKNLIFEFDWKETCIYVFEDYDYINFNKDNIKYINLHNPYVRFVFISKNRIKRFKNISAIEIPPFTYQEISDLILKKFPDKELHNYLYEKILQHRIMEIANGNPLFINLVIEHILENGSINIDTLKTIYKPCIVDQFGKPIERIDNSTKIIVTEINDELLYEISQNPKLLHILSSYDFERVIARMFEKKGFTVKITPQTRDGGKDIFIAKNNLFSFLFYVECKKYSPNRPVGIEVIQRLYGVISAEKATGGIIATTSYFTKPAKDYIQEHQLENKLALQDYNTISDILKSLQYNTK